MQLAMSIAVILICLGVIGIGYGGCTGNANTYIDQNDDSDACWSYSWWPGCGSSGDQGSSIWVLKS